jgi:DNA-binding MurR/RpiR family transcriptional regulator
MSTVDSTKDKIREAYDNLTKSEQQVADYFLENTEISDFSSKHISLLLYVSEATLSRFAKKCGFKGYREFVYMYELDFKDYFTEKEEKEISDITRSVRKNYKDIMVKAFDLIDEDQMRRIATKLSNTEYTVPVYGMGSSGYVAREFQLRFMRLGLDVIAITDSQMIAMNASLVKRGSLVLAFSISGTTKVVIDGIKKAKQNGARVVLFTASKDKKLAELCDEIVEVAYLKELEKGTKISPQISLLILIDVLYSYYFANDSFFKAEKYKRTLTALEIEKNISPL